MSFGLPRRGLSPHTAKKRRGTSSMMGGDTLDVGGGGGHGGGRVQPTRSLMARREEEAAVDAALRAHSQTSTTYSHNQQRAKSNSSTMGAGARGSASRDGYQMSYAPHHHQYPSTNIRSAPVVGAAAPIQRVGLEKQKQRHLYFGGVRADGEEDADGPVFGTTAAVSTNNNIMMFPPSRSTSPPTTKPHQQQYPSSRSGSAAGGELLGSRKTSMRRGGGRQSQMSASPSPPPSPGFNRSMSATRSVTVGGTTTALRKKLLRKVDMQRNERSFIDSRVLTTTPEVSTASSRNLSDVDSLMNGARRSSTIGDDARGSHNNSSRVLLRGGGDGDAYWKTPAIANNNGAGGGTSRHNKGRRTPSSHSPKSHNNSRSPLRQLHRTSRTGGGEIERDAVAMELLYGITTTRKDSSAAMSTMLPPSNIWCSPNAVLETSSEHAYGFEQIHSSSSASPDLPSSRGSHEDLTSTASTHRSEHDADDDEYRMGDIVRPSSSDDDASDEDASSISTASSPSIASATKTKADGRHGQQQHPTPRSNADAKSQTHNPIPAPTTRALFTQGTQVSRQPSTNYTIHPTPVVSRTSSRRKDGGSGGGGSKPATPTLRTPSSKTAGCDDSPLGSPSGRQPSRLPTPANTTTASSTTASSSSTAVHTTTTSVTTATTSSAVSRTESLLDVLAEDGSGEGLLLPHPAVPSRLATPVSSIRRPSSSTDHVIPTTKQQPPSSNAGFNVDDDALLIHVPSGLKVVAPSSERGDGVAAGRVVSAAVPSNVTSSHHSSRSASTIRVIHSEKDQRISSVSAGSSSSRTPEIIVPSRTPSTLISSSSDDDDDLRELEGRVQRMYDYKPPASETRSSSNPSFARQVPSILSSTDSSNSLLMRVGSRVVQRGGDKDGDVSRRESLREIAEQIERDEEEERQQRQRARQLMEEERQQRLRARQLMEEERSGSSRGSSLSDFEVQYGVPSAPQDVNEKVDADGNV